MTPASFPGRWILANSIGWLAGFALVLALAMLVEAFAGGVQVIVGLGMGAGVGFVQARILKPWLGSTWPWARATLLGITAPFLLQDLVRVVGLGLPTSLWLYVPVGGLLAAVLQKRLLDQAFRSGGGWLLPGTLGWTAPVLLIALGDEVASLGVLGGFLSLAGMFLGGVLLGAMTAGPLRARLPFPDEGAGPP